MADWRITCDRSADGFVRAAVWRGKNLTDLYVDRLDQPDMTGAVVAGKAVRVKTTGQAWFEAGLSQTLYVEAGKGVRVGDKCALRIQTTRGQAKGWSAVIDKETEVLEVGVLVPPPPVWVRAVSDAMRSGRGTIALQERDDHRLCEAWLAQHSAKLKLDPWSRDAVHPDLDDRIEELRAPRVALMGGGEIVIEQTEALVAIDVNAGEAGNATSVNLKAVQEIARQIRLRNLSGMIVMDILRMSARADGSKVMNALTRATQDDPCAVNCFGVSKIGLLEATRTRRGPSLAEIMGK